MTMPTKAKLAETVDKEEIKNFWNKRVLGRQVLNARKERMEITHQYT